MPPERETPLYFELEASWHKVLADELKEPYIASISAFLEKERALGKTVYPPKELIFNAFFKTPFEQVKVVIVGQDPYHGPGQAHGLCFSVPKGVVPPPSLKNIFKELSSDLNLSVPAHGCLNSWAEQGVLLLNASLTVRQEEPMSHSRIGWARFTDAVIAQLCQRSDPLIFVLWGKFAQEKYNHIKSNQNSPHIVLKAAHPSPLSAHQGFLGCRHFSQINEILKNQKKSEINWKI